MTQNSGKEDNCRFLCQETRQNTNCVSKYRPILCRIYRAWGGKRYSTGKMQFSTAALYYQHILLSQLHRMRPSKISHRSFPCLIPNIPCCHYNPQAGRDWDRTRPSAHQFDYESSSAVSSRPSIIMGGQSRHWVPHCMPICRRNTRLSNHQGSMEIMI